MICRHSSKFYKIRDFCLFEYLFILFYSIKRHRRPIYMYKDASLHQPSPYFDTNILSCFQSEWYPLKCSAIAPKITDEWFSCGGHGGLRPSNVVKLFKFQIVKQYLDLSTTQSHQNIFIFSRRYTLLIVFWFHNLIIKRTSDEKTVVRRSRLIVSLKYLCIYSL